MSPVLPSRANPDAWLLSIARQPYAYGCCRASGIPVLVEREAASPGVREVYRRSRQEKEYLCWRVHAIRNSEKQTKPVAFASQLLFVPVPLNRDASDVARVLNQLDVVGRGASWFTIIDRKRTRSFAFACEQGARPNGANSIRDHAVTIVFFSQMGSVRMSVTYTGSFR